MGCDTARVPIIDVTETRGVIEEACKEAVLFIIIGDTNLVSTMMINVGITKTLQNEYQETPLLSTISLYHCD